MITYGIFGKPGGGNLGNQLFEFASLIGLAETFGHELKLPPWKYAEHFKGAHPTKTITGANVSEKHFHYDLKQFEALKDKNKTFDLRGWLQSEKYWKHCEEKVRAHFEFKDALVTRVRAKFKAAFAKPTIAISIRQGDYVGNPNYDLLPINFYIMALYEHFPNWKEFNLLLFSDDIPYCKHHFACLPNAFFAEGSDIEQLCAMSLCNNLIIANSTFSWWGAYLNRKGGKVIRPNYIFKGGLIKNNIADHYPEQWITHDHKTGGYNNKIDLGDVTFVMPVGYDHPDRRENLELNVCLLQQWFETNIIIGEQGPKPMFQFTGAFARYHYFEEMQTFHRTRMLNEMFAMADTPIVFNWDVDVIACPMQIIQAVERMRAGVDMVYPYDGRFARVERAKWRKVLETRLDTGVFGITHFKGMAGVPGMKDWLSVGGAVGFIKEKFFEGGGENEHFVSYGPEDMERIFRFEKLGYKVERIQGPIYHLDHYIGPNSSSRHKDFQANADLWQKIKAMDKKALEEYVETFEWACVGC